MVYSMSRRSMTLPILKLTPQSQYGIGEALTLYTLVLF